jgi:uncharacterized protein (TIGR02391 family)
MARRAVPEREIAAPSLTPQRAVELLQRQIERFATIVTLRRSDPELLKWMETTEGVLKGAFGEAHDLVQRFKHQYGSVLMNMSDAYYEGEHQKRMLRRKAVLESCIEQLEILAPSPALVMPGRYQFHAEIDRVSADLLRDGHYKQAAFEAYIRVIDEVKIRSGLGLDGDSLMNHAFGCDGRDPILRFNTLATEAEPEEQKGIMFLFKGIIGLRNSKAHSNRLFNDPSRAHEYLATASLLMRLLEVAHRA